jgi:hypothetical protein
MVRMSADGTLPPAQRLHYKNAIHGLYRIAKEDGLARCFRGVQLTLARSVVMNASQLSWYVHLNVWRMKLTPSATTSSRKDCS